MSRSISQFLSSGAPIWVGWAIFYRTSSTAAIALLPESDTDFRKRLLKLLAIGLNSRRLRLWAAHPRPQPAASPAPANNRLCQRAPEAPPPVVHQQSLLSSERTYRATSSYGRLLINGEAGTTQPDGAPPTVIAVIRAHHPQLPGSPSRSSRSASSRRGHPDICSNDVGRESSVER